ncbi:MAG: HAD family hydrolase [Pseudomonadota bacterium]
MWSGPRNISTAMMRAFENRADCAVMDEPFYAAFLAASGLDHPMRDAVIAAGETDPAKVADAVCGASASTTEPAAAAVVYQKHMTHHMLPAFDRGWMADSGITHAFLIRAPERVVASYARKRAAVTLDDLGVTQQAALFDEVAALRGRPAPVIDADDVLADPEGLLRALCSACGIAFDPCMLAWPPGRRTSDGVWAAHWYGAVEASTGFTRTPPAPLPMLEGAHAEIAAGARPLYEQLAAYRLRA